MQTVLVLNEAGANTDDIDLARSFSMLNRKIMEPVDNKGNAQMYHVQIKSLCDNTSVNRTTVNTAGTGYATKQAVKAWYRVWRQKFRDAGISQKDLGPYGRIFKPKLRNLGYTSGGDIWGGTGAFSGEWNYSEVVTTPAADHTGGSGAAEGEDLADQFHLHLTGASVVQDTGDGQDETLKFVSVGMIDSWLGSRRKNVGLTSDTVTESELFDADNPLLLTRQGELSSQAMLDEVRDLQADLPPYDEATHSALFTQGVVEHSGSDMGVINVSAPCGWINVVTTQPATLEITLLGITDM